MKRFPSGQERRRGARRRRVGMKVRRACEKLLRFARGVPAAAALIALPIVLRWTSWVQGNLPAEYATAAATADAAGDLETAVLAYRRLVQIGDGQDEFTFGLADALARAGKPEQAELMVRRITPLDKPGHAPARIWLANRLITGAMPTAEAVDLAERQLTLVLQDDPQSAEAKTLLCRLCLDAGRLSEAEHHLADSALEIRFDLKLRLARAFWSIGDRRRATDYARDVEPFVRLRVSRDPADLETRLYLAEAQALSQEFGDAETTLKSGLALKTGDDGRLWGALGGVYLAWAESMPDRTSYERRARTSRLEASLDSLLAGPQGDADIDRQTALVYLKLRRLPEAEPPLRRAAAVYPGLLLEWARLHGVLGDNQKAVEIAEDACRRFRDSLLLAPQSEELRLLAADAEFLLGRHSAALDTLKAGLTTGRETVLQRAAAQVLVNWSEAVEQSSPADSQRIVDLTMQALAVDPWNAQAVQRLEVLRTRLPASDNPAAKSLKALLVAGEPPVTVLAALGARAMALGELDRARTLLERAYRTDILRVEVASNLAWVLAHQEKPDLPRALEIATRAIGPFSQPPATLLGTRGEIYAKMGQWTEARRDLEAAQPDLMGRPEFHAQLARVYEQLGEAALAELQRSLASRKPDPVDERRE